MDELETQDEITGAAQPHGGKVAMVVDYVTSAQREMEKVTWPSTEELTNSTRMVIIGALSLGVIIGLFDFLLNKILINGVAMLGQ